MPVRRQTFSLLDFDEQACPSYSSGPNGDQGLDEIGEGSVKARSLPHSFEPEICFRVASTTLVASFTSLACPFGSLQKQVTSPVLQSQLTRARAAIRLPGTPHRAFSRRAAYLMALPSSMMTRKLAGVPTLGCTCLSTASPCALPGAALILTHLFEHKG